MRELILRRTKSSEHKISIQNVVCAVRAALFLWEVSLLYIAVLHPHWLQCKNPSEHILWIEETFDKLSAIGCVSIKDYLLYEA